MSSIPIEINTDLIDNSDTRDSDYTNMATSLLNDILHRIRCSNLNFQLQISPFSAHVSLKKTFIRDKLGNMLPPSASVLPVDDKYLRNLEDQNQLLLKENEELKIALKEAAEKLQVKSEEDSPIHYLNLKVEEIEKDKTVLAAQLNKSKAKLGDTEKKFRSSEETIKDLKEALASCQENHQMEIASNAKEWKTKIKDLNNKIKSKEKMVLKLEKEVALFTKSEVSMPIEISTIQCENNSVGNEKDVHANKSNEVKSESKKVPAGETNQPYTGKIDESHKHRESNSQPQPDVDALDRKTSFVDVYWCDRHPLNILYKKPFYKKKR